MLAAHHLPLPYCYKPTVMSSTHNHIVNSYRASQVSQDLALLVEGKKAKDANYNTQKDES